MGSVGRRKGLEAVSESQLQSGVSVNASGNPRLTSEAAFVAAMGNAMASGNIQEYYNLRNQFTEFLQNNYKK
jgi:hypothetical protein